MPVPISLMGITFTTRSQNDILYSAIANQVCVPLYNNVKPILKFISIQEVFFSIFNSDSVVKNNQNQKAGKVSQSFLKTVNLGALSIWEPSTRRHFFLLLILFIKLLLRNKCEMGEQFFLKLH